VRTRRETSILKAEIWRHEHELFANSNRLGFLLIASPLTPALSPEERENRFQFGREIEAFGLAKDRMRDSLSPRERHLSWSASIF
jgi:hypothetical protein